MLSLAPGLDSAPVQAAAGRRSTPLGGLEPKQTSSCSFALSSEAGGIQGQPCLVGRGEQRGGSSRKNKDEVLEKHQKRMEKADVVTRPAYNMVGLPVPDKRKSPSS